MFVECRPGVVRCARAFRCGRLRAPKRPDAAHFLRPQRACAVVSLLAGANSGLLQAEAKKYVGGLGKADRAAALDDARAFREKHPAGSKCAMAAFDSLSQIGKFAVRILASITGGAVPRGCVVASSLRRPALVQLAVFRALACK